MSPPGHGVLVVRCFQLMGSPGVSKSLCPWLTVLSGRHTAFMMLSALPLTVYVYAANERGIVAFSVPTLVY